MLTTQHHLHQLLKKQSKTQSQRQQIVKLIRTHHYDLPQVVFQQSYHLIKTGVSQKNKYHAVHDLITSGLQLQIGPKIKYYIQKFRQAIGEVPSIKRLFSLVGLINSNQPSDDYFAQHIVEDKTNWQCKKLSLSVHKIKYQWEQYVKGINMYLKQNPADKQAWMELGDFYTQKGQYLRALFCYQQVIMLAPENHYYFLRLAELYYSDGGKQNVNTSIKYFSYVISKNPSNPRALWGLYRALWSQKQTLDEQDAQLLQKTGDTIRKLYAKKNPNLKINLAL